MSKLAATCSDYVTSRKQFHAAEHVVCILLSLWLPFCCSGQAVVGVSLRVASSFDETGSSGPDSMDTTFASCKQHIC